MAASIDKRALRLLAALKKEQEREPDILKCRRIGVVADGMFSSQAEFDFVVRYCISRRFLESVQRDDGMASFVSREGHAFIESQKVEWHNSWLGILTLSVVGGIIVGFVLWKLGWL